MGALLEQKLNLLIMPLLPGWLKKLMPPRPFAIAGPAIVVFLASVMGGLLFNLLMPQGIGLLPPEIAAPTWQATAPAQANTLVSQGYVLLDARPASDYSQSRVRGAIKFSFDELDILYPFMEPTLRNAPGIIIYGRKLSSFPAATAGQYLGAKGFDKVYVLEANLEDMAQAGFNLLTPQKKAAP